MKNQLESMGAIWQGQRNNGEIYYQGEIRLPDGNHLKIQIYQNKWKTADSTLPDMVVWCRIADWQELALLMQPEAEAVEPARG